MKLSKIISIIFFMLFFVTSAGAAFAMAVEESVWDGELVITTRKGGDVNVRRGPSTEYRSVGKAKNGRHYTISGRARGEDGFTWYCIFAEDNAYGWVRGDFCKVLRITVERPDDEDELDDPYGGTTDIRVIEEEYRRNPFKTKKDWVNQEIYIAGNVLSMDEIDDFYLVTLAENEYATAAYICVFSKRGDNTELFKLSKNQGVIMEGKVKDFREERDKIMPSKTYVFIAISDPKIIEIIK